MEDPLTLVSPRPATPSRPLLGRTVLVVEDSLFACEALRLMCLRSGARIRRADCLRSARRHLKVYRPSIAIIDLGLPDGSGTELIEELSNASPRADVILAISGDDGNQAAAIAAGSDGFLAKPLKSLITFQRAILSRLPRSLQPNGLCLSLTQDDNIQPDPIAYLDDMAHLADVLGDGCTDKTIDYIAQFTSGVARSADDSALFGAAQALAKSRAAGQPVRSSLARLAGLVQQRLAKKMVI